MARVGQQLTSPESGYKRYMYTDKNFEYSSGWTDNDGADKISLTVGDTIKFNFFGDSIYVLVHSWSNRGVMSISIDGDTPIEYKGNQGANANDYVAFIANDLDNKWHDVTITVLSTTGTLRAIDIKGEIGKYDESFRVKKRMVLKNTLNSKVYSMVDNILIPLPNTSDKNMILWGIEQGKEIQLDVPFTKIITVIENGDDTQSVVEEDVEPFSVYDYISETPEVLVYTESTDDIQVSTTTEPFTVYDEFGDEVEVLYYTDEETVTEADLILEANWSPLDELEGDIEVVTWTDESPDTAQRILETTATPAPKFVSSTTVTNIIGDLQGLNIQGDGKFLLTHNNSQWFKWNGVDFAPVNVQNVNIEGMTSQEAISADYSKWTYDKINIGLFIENNNVVNHIGINQLLPNKTSTLSNINFYILNTTARIDLELAGLSLTGSLSDADLTRVQYKVTLNGEPFFPKNGEWTALSEPPQNINITMKTSDIKMMDWNTLRVDFKDFFGTEDYWQTTFVGNYASLMFKDVDGNYYSDDVGQVLQYLDFGNIVAGEVTVSHEIILKNQYGYAVKDIEIVPNTSYLPEGVLIEMSKTNDPFIPESDLLYTEGLADNEELSFFVRMNTDVNSIPNEHNKFDVFVKASRRDV